jgi:1-acyl-sn-glycerol-3-phosphate acyltransferase
MGSTSEITGWWRVAAAIVLPVARLLFRLRVLGAERLPADGPGIVAANHVSMFDGPMVCIPPWRRGRMVRFLSAAEYFEHPVLGRALRATRQIPIRRGASDAGALDEAIATIRAGALAGVFPEGRVNDRPTGELQRIRSGIARVALATGATVYPIGIWGTQHRLPRGGIRWALPLRPPLTFAVGDPIDPPARTGTGGEPSDDEIEAFLVRVRDRLTDAVKVARTEAEARVPSRR